MSAPHAAAQPAPLPSNRSFGLLFVVVFALAAAWAWWRSSTWLTVWLLALMVTIAITIAAPRLLMPLNRMWRKLGEILHALVSPVVLGILFYGVVAPFGVARRWLGGDPLARTFEPQRETYWVDRTPPGPSSDSFPHQF